MLHYRWVSVSIATLVFAVPVVAETTELRPVRIAAPVNGHIHPSMCLSKQGTLVVTYGHVNHRNLRITRSTDGGRTWSTPSPFIYTIGKTYYPGSLTTLQDGRLLHAWNRWSEDTNEKEPRSVIYSLSRDEGLTWSEPKPFPRDLKVRSVIRHPIVELSAQEWLVPLDDQTLVFDPTTQSSHPFGDGRVHGLIPIVRTPRGTFISGAGLRSTDQGKTWTGIHGFPDLKSQGWRHEMVCLANGWLLASEILGPGFGGEKIQYRISRDDGLSWKDTFEYYNPGRAINGRACPRTVQLDDQNIGVVFYDIDAKQAGGPGLFFLRIPLSKLAAQQEPRVSAFPGAEGAGKWARGGRGGRAIAVTNLHDDGPGSLRAAVEAAGPRTVVFRVSGTIELMKPLRVQHPFITIAGQTAPGDGICLKGQELQIGQTHDVIVRHLRCRLGDKTSQAGDRDAITLWDVRDVILDHCSATWSTDECLSVTRDSDRVTVQHCLIAEALTEHSFGSIIGAYRGDISFLFNLYASNRARNPRPSGYQAMPEPGRADDPGPRIDFRNNVIFNWTSGAGYTGSDNPAELERTAVNYVGNYLKPGLDTSPAYRDKALTLYGGARMELYLAGNQIAGLPKASAGQQELLVVRPHASVTFRDAPLPITAPAEVLSAETAYANVLKEVGAVKPRRDSVDTRIVSEVRDGAGRRQMTIGPDAWPNLRSAEPQPDSDGDGIPDAWEESHGLSKTDPTDAARVAGSVGWTHLEIWLNQL